MQQTRFRNRALPALALGVAMIVCLGGRDLVYAQAFQFHYGSPNCREAGRSGVFQLVGGGYVAVGETFFSVAGCTTTDIYVVRTNANGTLNWSGTYNIGGNDSATSVIQNTVNNDLYICGVTQNTGGCTNTRDGFILRINVNTGGVVALNTFGSTRDEIFYDIVQARTGDGMTTNNGDVIAVGSSTLNSGTGRDGWMVRANAALGFVWSRTYGGAGSADDYFFAVDEASFGVAGTAADVIAVGGTTTFGAGLGDILVSRVSGQNGVEGVAPQNTAVYGGTRLDEGRSIRQIRVGASAGEFIVTGNSHSRPAPSTSTEGFLLHLAKDPCLAQICDLYFGDDAGGLDNGRCVREVPAGAPAGMTSGNYVVTGTTVRGSAVVSGNNAYLYEFSPTCGGVGLGMAYGGNGFDEGWSVNTAFNNVAPQTPGYIIAGYTQSSSLIGAANPQQLYLIKARTTKVSGCNEVSFSFSTEAALFTRSCVAMLSITFGGNCQRATTMVPTTWATQLCFAAATKERNNGNDGVSGVESSATIGMNESEAAFYPNPVTSGMPVNLKFMLKNESVVTIVVSDLLGNVVYRQGARYAAGTALHALTTTGWAPGNYLVAITRPDHTPISRVITVVDGR